ncbi:MAG: protein-disulfide reductase DsbD domain-containing protein [Pseudomonadota bacterium]
MAAAIATPSHAQTSVVVTDHVRAQLVAHAPDGIRAGAQVRLGLAITHAPHWHTYWKNPGDSGLPTTLSWVLPTGFSTGDIEWPTPRQLPLAPLMNYGYTGQVLLPVTVNVPRDLPGAALDIRLHAEWLVCKEICLPESGDFHLSVPSKGPSIVSKTLFDAASAAQPLSAASVQTRAGIVGEALVLSLRGLPSSLPRQGLQLFVEEPGVVEHAAQVTQRWSGDTLTLSVPLSKQRSDSPATMHAVLASRDQAAGLRFSFSTVDAWPDPAGAAPSAVASLPAAKEATTTLPFAFALMFAFVGGALLNLMPCVFPILSMKVIGLARNAVHRNKVRAGGIAYTAGVVMSFVALAGLLIGLRAGGAHLGWGFQLQSPMIVAMLAILFSLLGLNLVGMFEFGSILPGRVAGLRARHPLADDFLSGTLAVVVASPCTAPFMGAALGAALTLAPLAALAVFATLGLGMAAPYLAASFWPGAARLFPRSGQWMERFKTLMAFPMFATVVWLVWVLGQQVGNDGVAALLGVLVATALFMWTLSTPANRS